MSFLSRVGAIVGGLGYAADELGGLVVDLAKAPFVDDPNLDGFLHTLTGRTMYRGSNMLQDLFGPKDSLVGSSIGAIPEQVRNPINTVVHPVLQGNQWLYTNGISHPLSTLLTVGSLTESARWRAAHGGESNWGAFFDPTAWSDAWKMSNHTSPGQALAMNLHFALGASLGKGPDPNNDIMDPAKCRSSRAPISISRRPGSWTRSLTSSLIR